jgi:hypothetical protein
MLCRFGVGTPLCLPGTIQKGSKLHFSLSSDIVSGFCFAWYAG